MDKNANYVFDFFKKKQRNNVCRISYYVFVFFKKIKEITDATGRSYVPDIPDPMSLNWHNYFGFFFEKYKESFGTSF